MTDTEVLIIGAGPVGLLLALDLASRGIQVVVAEMRPAGQPPSVKCNHVSSRTMETLRRLGLSREVRAVGLPHDYPNDIVFRTRMTGTELARIPIPLRRNRYQDRSGPDGWWPTPEPPHRVNQIFFEPIFFAHAAQHPNITLLNETRFDSVEDEGGSVRALLIDLPTGTSREIRCRYMVGCDGGSSAVRKQIGGKLEGDAVVQRVQSTLIDAPDLLDALGSGPAWMNYNYNPDRAGTVLAIDGERRWLVHNYLRPDEETFEEVDRDRCIRHILGVGPDFPFTQLSNEDWIGRRLVADRFRQGRVFIAGDAAHLWVPYAGYGMNAGIADAMDLSWMLAATLQGWAPDGILDAYVAERKPITEQVSRFAMGHASGAIKERNTLPPEIEDDTPEGEAARQAVGAAAYALNVQQYACAGLNYGYFYDASPIIAYDGEAAPAYTMHDYTPSTAPGCRVPHFFLADGRSLYDLCGPGYTLIRIDDEGDAAPDVEPLVAAARACGMPLAVIRVDRALDGVPDVYRHRLLLVRPDGHVAWRGDAIDDAASLVDLLRGARMTA
ncbi:FAD-dependent oxidoreductase [Sphingobium sp. B11D3D]|uniref:FAD-dependent oxidoreductase n=1 Tax=Sphingobium sp. B11D3D TaxID=2940576 RepID=UPI0022245936|nr:FAD-dependent oxidoreductase [Sphingobium sp. B11D3D]MCW2368341.1 2-polyprenyl-6-methoxyphenol hydroxylase-like FAD-dependent oxidoreductase [Sphingobium sp. B11D3D]